MNIFQDYSRYYDLFYQDKDYRGEARYVDQLIKSLRPGAATLLELGCGTGGHAFPLAGLGYDVTGVDLSVVSLEKAQAKLESNPEGSETVRFHHGDIRDIQLPGSYDAAVALFHVLSYQTTSEDLRMTLATVREHLEPGSVFLFDFWHGPGVLSDPPKTAIKRLENDSWRIMRVAEPRMHVGRNVVDVQYTLFVEDKERDGIRRITETHSMRYFFELELREFLTEAGFRPESCYRWLTHEEPSLDCWSAVMTAIRE